MVTRGAGGVGGGERVWLRRDRVKRIWGGMELLNPAHGNGFMTRCLHQNYTLKRVHFAVCTFKNQF